MGATGDIIPDVALMAYRLGSHPSFQAEVRPAIPRWLVVRTVGGQERIAAAHLVGRRFGIYLPEMDEQKTKVPMFPGHLFVFVWDIAFHWQRITACPGVIDILGSLADEQIHQVQAIENEHNPLGSIKLSKKKRFRNRKRDEQPEYEDEIVAVRTWSALTDDSRPLDSDGRNKLLRRALGLA
jgi:transcription termination factor NusG